jgi:hypothetical protein
MMNMHDYIEPTEYIWNRILNQTNNNLIVPKWMNDNAKYPNHFLNIHRATFD